MPVARRPRTPRISPTRPSLYDGDTIAPPSMSSYIADTSERPYIEEHRLRSTRERINAYVLGLPFNSPQDSYNEEQQITRELADLGFFREVQNFFPAYDALETNENFNPQNLSHRFILHYYLMHGSTIRDVSYLLLQAIDSRTIINISTTPFSIDELQFLSVSRRSPNDDTEANNPIEFVVNGQKLRLSLASTVERESRSRYVNVITIRVASQRQSNVRTIAQISRYSDLDGVTGITFANMPLAFRRITTNRPFHGFKFVSSEPDNTSTLRVKELH